MCGDEGRLRYDGGVGHGPGAGGAGVREPPQPPPAFTGEDEQERTGAAAVAWMPAAAAFMALAGPQVWGEEGAPGMACEVCEGGRACGAAVKGFGNRAALGAHEQRSLRLGP
ncbi:hypothetical protein GCM10010222_80460 [Streptomyces tanashiensis]|nr:hypothetical protein GCM10010222_80460 [Streptomyces tanashiensis]